MINDALFKPFVIIKQNFLNYKSPVPVANSKVSPVKEKDLWLDLIIPVILYDF